MCLRLTQIDIIQEFCDCNTTCDPSVMLCHGRSPHCVHWRARSQELPPEEAPQTQVQPQGEAGTARAQHGGIQVRRRWIQRKYPQTSEWVNLNQRLVCVRVCSNGCGALWVGVFQTARKSQLTGYQCFFCWGGKRSFESWVERLKKKVKYPLTELWDGEDWITIWKEEKQAK